MKRALRLRVAALAACVIAFAQISAAAQVWPLAAAPNSDAPVPASASIVDVADHCASHLTGSDGAPGSQTGAPSPNVCEVRCQDAAQPDAFVVTVAAPGADAWLSVTIADPSSALARADSPFTPKCASPPARVLFARFLN